MANARAAGARDRGGRRAWALLACLLLAPLAAADAAVPAVEVPLALRASRSWNTGDGLPHNTVQAIAQTPEGYLWFGTWEGLARFNGRDWVVFDKSNTRALRDNGFRALLVAHDGSLWAGTARSGLLHYRQGRWQVVHRGEVPGEERVMALLEDDAGRVWAATDSEWVIRVEGDGRVQRLPLASGRPGNGALALARDRDGRVWIGTRQGLYRFDGDRFAAEPGLPGGDGAVQAITSDPQGRLLAVTPRGLFRRGDTGFAPVAGAERFGRDMAVETLLNDAGGHLLVGTQSQGLYCLCGSGLETLNTGSGLPNNRISALFRDRDDNLWIGTNQGLTRLRAGQVSNFGRLNGLSDDYVRAVLQARDGAVWVGTSDGLNRFADGRIERVRIGAGQNADSIFSLGEDAAGTLWVGTSDSGIATLAPDGRIGRFTTAEGLLSNQVRTFLAERDGIWVGTNAGLVRIVDGRVRDRFPRLGSVRALDRDRDGRLWVGSTQGLWRQDGDGFEPWAREVIGERYVFGLHRDARGVLWVAADDGLYRIENGRTAALREDRGLRFVPVLAVLGAGDDLWLCSNHGVQRAPLASFDAAAAGEIDSLDGSGFGLAEGLADIQCNGGSGPVAMQARDGALWFATALGATVFNPRYLATPASPPRIVLEKVLVDGQPVDAAATLDFAAGVRRLQFDYAAISFDAPERIRYQVRLDGFDNEWQPATALTSAVYTNLGPGEYRLRVISDDGHGRWNARPLEQRFVIQAQVWQRPWFWALAALAALAALVMALRVRRELGLQRERELQALVEARTLELRERTQSLEQVNLQRDRLLRQLRERSVEMERLAGEDVLTGLANRRSLEQSLEQLYAHAVASGEPMALAIADVDHFKRINDSFSHAVGDDVLQRVAQALRDGLREGDLVARFGGEEFVILFPGTGPAEAKEICERLRQAVSALQFDGRAPGLRVTMSFGLCGGLGAGSAAAMLNAADLALYAAKAAGRDRVMMAPDAGP